MLLSLGAPDGAGLLVIKVYDRSRAQEAGMQSGDVIVEAMGLPITTLESLRQVLRAQGDRVMPVKVVRERHPLLLSVEPIPEPPPLPPPAGGTAPRYRKRSPVPR